MWRAKALRREAETCRLLSLACSDPLTAEHLRSMAAEFFERAYQMENGSRPPRAAPRHPSEPRDPGPPAV